MRTISLLFAFIALELLELYFIFVILGLVVPFLVGANIIRLLFRLFSA